MTAKERYQQRHARRTKANADKRMRGLPREFARSHGALNDDHDQLAPVDFLTLAMSKLSAVARGNSQPIVSRESSNISPGLVHAMIIAGFRRSQKLVASS